MTDVAPIMGLYIRLARTSDRPCFACDRTTQVIGPGAGPHLASLRCASCDRHRGWLPKPIAEFLVDLVSRFGRPDEAISIQNSEIIPTPDAQRCSRAIPVVSE